MEATAFWDKVAPKYFTDPIDNLEAYEAGLARVRHYLSTDMRALEIGCGTGMTALKLASAVQAYVGTDISPEMIRLADTRLDALDAPSNVTFQSAAATEAGQGGSYDAVLGFNLLHLVPDIDQTAAHARRFLKPGGLFITKTPCLGEKFYFAPMIKMAQLLGKAPKPVHCATVPKLTGMIESAGFDIVEQGGYPPKLPSLLVVARAT